MLEVVQQTVEDAAKLAATPLWSLNDADLTACLRAAHRLEQTAATLQARLVDLAVTRGMPRAQGHRTTAGWLREQLRLDPQRARDLTDQAAAIRSRPRLEQALLDGSIDPPQATVIAAAVNAIATIRQDPDAAGDADPSIPGLDFLTSQQITDEAETALIEMAGRFPAYQLRRLGERILAHVAPEIADRADEAILRRQEQRAQAQRFLTLSLPVNGIVRVTGSLSAEDAAIVSAALHPLCTPIPDDPRTPGQRRADALTDVCRLALRSTQLPDDGGEPPQITVTVPLDPLTRTLGIGTLDNGQRLSAAATRRLACDARILPLILGGQSQILDAGRTRRLATGPLRRALTARDHGCAFPNCDRPARWCDAHHLTPWSAGGSTRLDNLVLLCRHHHRTLHDPRSGWTARLGPDQLPEFIPPPWTDPTQRPRRNLYHPRR